jgi:hypothetical protein
MGGHHYFGGLGSVREKQERILKGLVGKRKEKEKGEIFNTT